jgi:hypothetical protein
LILIFAIAITQGDLTVLDRKDALVFFASIHSSLDT